MNIFLIPLVKIKYINALFFLEEGLQKGYDFYLKYDGITEEKNKYMFLKDKHLK